MTQDEQKQEEKTELTFEDLLKELPIPDKYKAALTNLLTNLVGSITQVNQRLTAMETKGDEFSKSKYDGSGLSGEQIYNIEMAKATAPAAAAQQQLFSSLLGSRSGGGGGDFGSLVKNAEALNSLRNFLIPPPSPLEVAMQKTQIAQMLAQTRLMNKVAGKETDSFLDKLATDLGEEEK
ncbi:hypothetical protein ES705_16959 [subsurface metagenome]